MLEARKYPYGIVILTCDLEGHVMGNVLLVIHKSEKG